MNLWNKNTTNKDNNMKFEKIAEDFFINASEKFQEYAEWSGMGMNGVSSFKDYDDMLTSCSIDFKKQEFILSWIYDYSDTPRSQSKTAYTLAFPFCILDMDEDAIHKLAPLA
jgi:hypothetical protein